MGSLFSEPEPKNAGHHDEHERRRRPKPTNDYSPHRGRRHEPQQGRRPVPENDDPPHRGRRFEPEPTTEDGKFYSKMHLKKLIIQK